MGWDDAGKMIWKFGRPSGMWRYLLPGIMLGLPATMGAVGRKGVERFLGGEVSIRVPIDTRGE